MFGRAIFVACSECGEHLGSGDADDDEHQEIAELQAAEVEMYGCPFCRSHATPDVFEDAED